MTQPGEFESHRRTRVGGARQSRLIGFVVALGALLLLAMVVIASQDMPPAPAALPVARPPLASPAPSPAPGRPETDLVYLFGERFDNNRTSAPFLGVWDNLGRERYTVDGLQSGVLAPDGKRLYAATSTAIVALDTASGDQLWQIDPTPLHEQITYSNLALTPDGRTLAVYQQEVDPATQAPSIRLSLLDAATGDVAKTTLIFMSAGASEIVFADNATLYLIAGGAVQSLNIETDRSNLLHQASAGQLAAALSPDRTTLYVTDGLEEIVAYDALKQTELRRLSLAEARIAAPVTNLDLQVSPDGTRLALLASQESAPTIREGRRATYSEGMRILTLDAQTGRLGPQTRQRTEGWWSSLSHSSDGTKLYFLDNSAPKVWDIGQASSRSNQQLNASNEWISSMLTGPYVPPAPRRTPVVTPTPAPSATPEPTPAPIVTADATPFVWLWQSQGDKERIVEYRRDGSASVVADAVLATIERAGQPPLLLVALDPTRWGLFDPTTGISTPLKMTLSPEAQTDHPLPLNNLVLSPNGEAIAFITSFDPLPGDTYSSLQQLVIIGRRSGEVHVLADVSTWDSGRSGYITAWTADGIYVDGRYTGASIEAPRGIWRINPNQPDPAPEQLLGLGDLGANVDFNATHQLVLYEPIPADLEQAELRLRNLRSDTETVIYAGPFIDRGDLLIAPDGAHIAYIRRADGLTSEVVLYAVASGTARRIASVSQFQNWYGWEPSLRWSSDGATLFVRDHQLDGAGKRYDVGYRASDGAQTSQIELPQPSPDAFRSSDRRFSADDQRLVTTDTQIADTSADFKYYLLLSLYQLQPATQRLVELPLELDQADLELGFTPYPRQRIVYVP
jgi:Tol biopolymer transport system component